MFFTIWHFEQAWKRLARFGRCDGLGGAEYRRVLREWIEAGWPRRIENFIMLRARLAAPPAEGEPPFPSMN